MEHNDQETTQEMITIGRRKRTESFDSQACDDDDEASVAAADDDTVAEEEEDDDEESLEGGEDSSLEGGEDSFSEDEEVKCSCFGKKFYSSSSSSEGEDDDDMFEVDDCDDSDGLDNRKEDYHTEDKYHDDSSTISTCSEADSETFSDDEDDDYERIGKRPQMKKFTFDLQECEPGKILRPTPVTLEHFRALNMNSWDDADDKNDDEDDNNEEVKSSNESDIYPEDDEGYDNDIDNDDEDCEDDEAEKDLGVDGSGSYDDESSAKEFESIMDKIQKEDTFYESTTASDSSSDNGMMKEVANLQNMDNIDSISCQVLNRKRCYDNESRLPSKKRSRTIASSFVPLPSCKTFTKQGDFTPFSENNYKVDCQLAEELLGCVTPNEGNSCTDSNPVPLLTPPASPMPIKSNESIVEIYEWPSNLAVDNALTAAIQLRALSPSSLAKLEDDKQEGFVFSLYPRNVRSVTKDFTTI